MAYQFFNDNPCKKLANDCVIRAISCFFNRSWEDTYLDVCSEGLRMCDMPSTNSVWNSYLFKNGCEKVSVPSGYTVKEFVLECPEREYIISTGNHAICVKNGNYLDAWDSGNEIVESYFRRKK